MRYGSVCSGIEAATAAWHPLGWEPAFFSEIEPFPRAVLAHHYPHVPLHGDFTTIKGNEYGAIDLLVGGTPCQSFSIAGLRGGLDDDRGNLALEFLRLADRTRPKRLVWENVPGVLSSNGGRDFGSILGGMVELGYGIAYRVLDAQYFGVAQRRRRVFVVGYLGDWRRAAAVLFERHSLQGHSAPRREAGQKPAPTISARPTGDGGLGTDFDLDGGLVHAPAVSPALKARDFKGPSSDGDGDGAPIIALQGTLIGRGENSGPQGPGFDVGGAVFTLTKADVHAVAHSLRGEGFDASEDGAGRGTPLVPVAFSGIDNGQDATENLTPTLRKGGDGAYGQAMAIASAMQVRRLTPRECERLQGFPDDYTLVPHRGKPAADGPRYKALGNSMAVPVMRWIGERIAMLEALGKSQ